MVAFIVIAGVCFTLCFVVCYCYFAVVFVIVCVAVLQLLILISVRDCSILTGQCCFARYCGAFVVLWFSMFCGLIVAVCLLCGVGFTVGLLWFDCLVACGCLWC